MFTFFFICCKTCYGHHVDKLLYAWEKNSINTRALILIPPLFEIFMCVSHILLMKNNMFKPNTSILMWSIENQHHPSSKISMLCLYIKPMEDTF